MLPQLIIFRLGVEGCRVVLPKMLKDNSLALSCRPGSFLNYVAKIFRKFENTAQNTELSVKRIKLNQTGSVGL
jgi:hypothetical protein